MNKNLIPFVVFLVFMSCSTQYKVKTEKHKTSNPNTPFIYKNGFKNYEITPSISIVENDTITFNELKFNAVQSAMYTQKLMYDKFGKWDTIIKPKNQLHLIFVWQNVKLFKNNEKTYTVAADGIESWEEMYASVIILNASNQDCLSVDSEIKDSLISYFSYGIKNLNSSVKFYSLYRKNYSKYIHN